MRWPWSRAGSQDRLFVSWSGNALAYVLARSGRGGAVELLGMGLERQGTDSPEDFAVRLGAMGLSGHSATVMLATDQCTLLQIAAPAVPPEELRAASKFLIRDMVDLHIDDLTLDVLHVGDGQEKSAGQLFVVTAPNAAIQGVMALAGQMQWPVSVIDIQEMGQRNLQSTLAARQGLADRATAALMVVNDHQALLTVSAKGELYYSRRLDLPEGFLAMTWGQEAEVFGESDEAPTPVAEYAPVSDYAPVGEYIPDYAGGLGADSGAATAAAADPTQRFVVELQRSMDLWDRTWTQLPMASLSVYAGVRTLDLAILLTQELGQVVEAMDVEGLFPALAGVGPQEKLACAPLLGVLLRDGVSGS
jgi:MSHA biogenesis protein MshI